MSEEIGLIENDSVQGAALTIIDLFSAQVQRTPNEIALTFQGDNLTYAELDDRSNRMACALSSRGAGPGAIVALAVERSLNLVVAILAVLKSGAAYLPLDPSAPQDRLQYMLADSEAVLTIATDETIARIGLNTDSRIINLNSDAAIRDQAASESDGPMGPRPSTVLSDGMMAYVIYTSGSTGRPKGVAVSHANVVALTPTMARFSPGPGETWTMFHSYSFDVSVWELWTPLLHGGRLVIVADETRRDPDAFLRLLEAERVTGFCQTPSAFFPLIDAVRARSATTLSLRHLIFAGEALDFRRLAPWYDKIPDNAPKIINMYGPTETTVYCTYKAIDRASAEGASASNIGCAIAGGELWVLDKALAPVPKGEIGELYIGGAGVAFGYFKRPGLTAERFIASPFGPHGARLYRTGDLVREWVNGDLEYLGRNDQQVKIRGFRIETGEIDAALVELPGVSQAVVVPREIGGDLKLVAYVVGLRGAPAPKAGELRAALGRTLPEYMIPAIFVDLPSLPLSSSGKLDRGALPAPQIVSDTNFRRPANETEQVLCEIFARLTGAARVGVDDSFFDIGGHSLLAVRLTVEIEKKFGRRLTLASVFQTPTSAGLALSLQEDAPPPPEWRSLLPIHQGGSEPPIFIVHWVERELARHLGASRPVWALSLGLARNFDGGNADLPNSIEETAAHYIDEMQMIRPEGPYYLIGHSAGGVVAFEMARQLTERGHEVGFLGLLDTAFPRVEKDLARHSTWTQILNMIKLPLRYKFQYISGYLRKFSYGFTKEKDRDDQGGSSLSYGYRAKFVNEIIQKYEPKPYIGKIDFFKSTIPPYLIRTIPPPPAELEWATVSKAGVGVHAVEGDHMDIIKDPLAARTASIIEACIKGSQ